MIDYGCPHCGQRYSLGDEWAGRDARCQKCNNVIRVPGTPAAAAAGAADPAQAVAAAAASYAEPPDGLGRVQPITAGMAQSLRQTRPWVLFLAILGFIGCGLIVLVGLVVMLAGSLVNQYGRHGGFGIPPVIGLIYMAMGLLYFFPAYYLVKYSGGISRFLGSGQSADMEAALASQKSFWKFVGILTVIVLSLYLLALVVFLFVSVSRF